MAQQNYDKVYSQIFLSSRGFHGDLCTWFDKLDIFFPFIEKILAPVCSTVPDCKPEAVCHGIAIRAKVEQKGRVIYIMNSAYTFKLAGALLLIL